MGSHFYMTLPSNSSMQYYPNNKTCKFTTKLHTPLSLNGDYEVALVEIQFQCTWYNVRETNNTITVFNKNTEDGIPLVLNVTLPTGYYYTGEELIDMINASLDKEWGQRVGLFYKKSSRKVYVQLRADTGLLIPCSLARMLGFDGECHLLESTESPMPVDPHMEFHTFYMYSDIVQYQNVGEVSVPLLRTIAARARKDQYNSVTTYNTPHYVPLKLYNFETIDIILTTESGEVVPFERGKLIVKLHFRERSPSL